MISQAWWPTPVILGTQEAKVGGYQSKASLGIKYETLSEK
jgi:hypothetical protein